MKYFGTLINPSLDFGLCPSVCPSRCRYKIFRYLYFFGNVRQNRVTLMLHTSAIVRVTLTLYTFRY